jgi:hypothetical protein
MFTPRNDDDMGLEPNLTPVGPVRQRRSTRVNAAKRSRTSARRKTKTGQKGSKIGGMHQRSNKRMSW